MFRLQLEFMKNILIQIFNGISTFFNKMAVRLSSDSGIEIIRTTYNDKGRFILFHLSNSHLESHKSVLRGIFTTLMRNDQFKKFGNNKVIIVSAIINNEEFSFHHNVLINNLTTFSDYYEKVRDTIKTNYEKGYSTDIIPQFKVRVWNMDEFSNRKIKITRDATTKKISYDNVPLSFKRMYSSFIKPIKAQNLDPGMSQFATMDIETVNVKGFQMPIAISLCYSNLTGIQSKIFIVNPSKFSKSPEKATEVLWNDLFKFITDNSGLFKNIFVHNLGSFDGLFLHKALSNKYPEPEMVNTLIDDNNKFIQITLNINNFSINWKDSYRLFSVSLDDLCKVFNVPGKTAKYDTRFNDIKFFRNARLSNLFIKYSLQDSVALYHALTKAQEIYSSKYSVDIAETLSSSSLSLKIFRALFLNTNIPVLKGIEDSFIRRGYFGGHTDYFKAYAKKLFYYDVNSLYPFAMLKDMPHEMIKFHKNMFNIKLEDFFGFCLCEVTTPKNILKPVLPYKHNGKTIYPTGTWIGVYFSEELKAIVKLGYHVRLIKGYEFSRINLFSGYVHHFYNQKKQAFGAERWIAKMHLNQLYGVFGRKQESIKTLNVYNRDLPFHIGTKFIKTIISINDEISTILISNNVDSNIIKELNSKFDTNISSFYTEVKSNVAIAAAVTSYGRIHMIPFILNGGTVYTDTDSIFTTTPLDPLLLGKDLGLMKDELEGSVIEEAYFLGIKRYGYWYTKNDVRIEQSVFSGIKRNSLTFSEITELFKGATLIKSVENRFYKSFKDLSIQIKNVNVSIKMDAAKPLINNTFIPINIINLNHSLDNRSYFNKLSNKILHYIKRYFN